MLDYRKFFTILFLAVLVANTGCSTVPVAAVELSNTVGRDLEEVHRSHHALAVLHFDKIVAEVNLFVDETYRAAFITQFASEFKLSDKVKLILKEDPEKLLPVMTRFVAIATERVEKKRKELLDPIEAQRRDVLKNIDLAHRQIQSAQAIVSGHLASVVKLHEVQNEVLAKVGLGDVRKHISTKTSEVSDAVKEIVKKGKKIDSGIATAKEKIEKFNEAITIAKDKLSKPAK